MSFFEKGEWELLRSLYFGNFITCTFYFIPAFTVIYLLGLGFSLTKIGFLMAILPLGTILFEIPTGAIADKYGRKFSVILGSFLEAIILFIIFFFNDYYSLVILFFLLGAVGTLYSGATESWIYDLIMNKNKKILKGYYSHFQLFCSVGAILSGIIGAFVVAKFGLSSIWLFSGLIYFVYAFFLMGIEEIYSVKKEHKNGFKEIWDQSVKSVKYSTKHNVLFWIFLAGFFMIIAVTFSETIAFTPYLKSLGFPDYAFGYFFSALSLVSAIAPLTANFFKGKKKELSFLIFATALGSIILLLIYFAKNYFVAIPIILLSLLFYAMKYPIERPFMQKFIPTNMRATILSTQSMVYSLAGVIALPIGGFLIDKFGALNVIIISALLGIPSIIAYLMIKETKA